MERAEVGLYDRFMRLSRDAFEAGNFEAAYHSLAGALKCAEVLHDPERMHEIEDETGRQCEIVDAEYPEHRVSSAAAATRGHASIYRSLLGQIRAATALADSQQD